MIKYTILTNFNSILFIDIVRIIGMIAFWFTIGILIYLYLKNKRPNSIILAFIENLKFYELVFVLFVIFKFISIITYLTADILLIDISFLMKIFNIKLPIISENGIEYINNNPRPDAPVLLNLPTPKVPTNINGNMICTIIATAVATSLSLVKKLSGVIVKIIVASGGVVIGAAGILVNSTINQITPDLSNKILNGNNYNLAALFGLTGNSIYDLILIIYQLQVLQLYLLYFFVYNLLLLYLNNNKVKLFLKNKLSKSAYNRIIKILRYMTKSSKILIGFIIFLIIIASILNVYYLGFFIENFDRMCELYFEYKSNKN